MLRVLANLLVQADKNDEAVATVRNVLKLNPNDPDLTFLLGGILMRVKKSDEAIAVFRSLIDRFPNDEQITKIAYSSISSVYADLNDFPKAEAELETIFAKYPDDAGMNNDLGYLYADQGKNLEKAEAMIRKALAEKTRQVRLSRQPGLGPVQAGQAQGGGRAPGEEPSRPARPSIAPTRRSHEHLGDVYFQLQEFAKAKAAWQDAEKIGRQGDPARQAAPRDPEEAQVAWN